MPDDTNESLKRVAASLDEVIGLLKQRSEERKALAAAIENRPGKFDQSAHNQRMEEIRQRGEIHRAQELEFRATLLTEIQEQTSILRRIEELLARS